MTAMTAVEVSHCTTVGKEACKDCTALNRIRLPKNCGIDATAFTGCDTVYIFAPVGGSTETYCAGDDDLIFVPIGE